MFHDGQENRVLRIAIPSLTLTTDLLKYIVRINNSLSLLHAADELVADDVLRATLGTGRDGDYVDYFARTKRDEFRTITDQVTSAELDTYLSLF